ncbi:MAG TPA: hypothetical protein VET24_12095 [Actinomycetota bacterium]|nr:hypothetical protein [Actinomycetota bacterium]
MLAFTRRFSSRGRGPSSPGSTVLPFPGPRSDTPTRGTGWNTETGTPSTSMVTSTYTMHSVSSGIMP